MELLALCKRTTSGTGVLSDHREKWRFWIILSFCRRRVLGLTAEAVAAVLERFSDRKLIFEIEKQDPWRKMPETGSARLFI